MNPIEGNSLKEKKIILTGATRGIGKATALRLAKEGAALALCGRDTEKLARTAREVVAAGAPEPFTRAFDLARPEAVLDFYKGARDSLGLPDILINNAGYNARKAPLSDVALEEFDSMFAVNTRAAFLLMREAVRDMKKQGSGHIVSVLSTVCHFDNETMGVYTATKKALQALTDILRKEVRPFGIRVTSIYPGGTNTEFRAKERPDYMRPESVAEAIVSALKMPEDLVVHHLTFRPMVETNF